MNICDLYNDEFRYFLPEEELKSYFNEYSDEEKTRLDKDIQTIFNTIIKQNPQKKMRAVINTGAPTTLLRSYHDQERSSVAFVDPEDVFLKKMHNACGIIDILEDKESVLTKWRPASIAIRHITLAKLIKEKYALYLDSCSDPKTFEFLKKRDYRIHLIHEISTGHDAQKLLNIYFKYADQIDFYYEKDHTASWMAEIEELAIYNQERYDTMVKAVWRGENPLSKNGTSADAPS